MENTGHDTMPEKSSSNLMNTVALILGVCTSAYHMYGGMFGFPVSMVHRPLHVMLILMLYYVLCASKSKGRADKALDFLLLLMAVLSCGYLVANSNYMLTRLQTIDPLRIWDIVFGLIFILLILESARRISGWALTILVGIFLLYGYFGKFLPNPLWHRGFSLERIIEQAYMSLEGAFGTPIYAVSTYVFLFILFGSFLESTGTGDFFTEFATALTGKSVGGQAKTAVVSSALMGSISGSAVANVVTTGSFTIPLMKKSGYEPRFAAAVEAVASTGGQIMPPVMGTAAFIMVELTAIPYAQLMVRALFPALLYYVAVFLMVDMEARRNGLKGIPKEQLPEMRVVMKKCYLFIPILIVIVFLIRGFTPGRAAIFAILSLLVLVFVFEPEKRKNMGKMIANAMFGAAKQCASVTVACAAAGILVGMIQMTGLGLRMTSIVLGLSGGKLLPALLLTMIMALILGMGMPTSGAYILLAALLTQGLMKMGVSLLAAHMFVFYFACMSAITPPVALATYAAATLADSKPWSTGLLAFRLGLTAFIVPFMFVYGEPLMLLGPPLTVLRSCASAFIGVFALAASLQGWWKGSIPMGLRIVLFGTAMMLIHPGIATDLIGAVILGGVLLYQEKKRKAVIKPV